MRPQTAQKIAGHPIQPVYAGHVDWYVDYSHGIRLVHRTIYVNNKAMDYRDVLKDPELKQLLSNEPGEMSFFAYPY
jgi:UDP-galactopyranose mutase